MSDDGCSGNQFEEATAAVEALVMAGDLRMRQDAAKLALYGLYKQASEGDCNVSRPSFLDFKGKAKWDAWSRNKGLSQEEAQLKYVELLTDLAPDWQQLVGGSSGGGGGGGGGARSTGWGPVFSSLSATQQEEEDGQSHQDMTPLHCACRDGDAESAAQELRSGADPAARDAQGCTALHWAADSGCMAVIRLLVGEEGGGQGGGGGVAEVDARDSEGQTPLHYAALCEHKQVCELLLKHGADANITTDAGETAADLAPAGWHIWPQKR